MASLRGIQTIIRAKPLFFDSAEVIAQTDRTQRRALSRLGAFVRTRARSSMRKRKASAAPGTPPSVHVGTLKKLVYFAYDPARKTVVVGPTRFGRGEAPALLEYGGRGSLGRYAARPFMQPALEEEKKNVARVWADAAK